MRARVIISALAAAAFAASSASAFTKRTEFTLPGDSVINGAFLEQGSYKVEVAPSLDSVSFYRGKSLVLTAPCRVRMMTERLPGDAVFTVPAAEGPQEVTRIMLLAPKIVIEFSHTGPEAIAASR